MDRDTKIALASYLRQKVGTLPEYQRPSVWEALAFLGDEAGLQELARRKSWGWLEETKNPRAVELIAEGMMVNDDPPTGLWRSIDAASYMQGILLHWPEIPENVREWMETVTRQYLPDGMAKRAILRVWWKENEAAWRRRDFAQLKPGGDPLLFGFRPQFGPNGERLFYNVAPSAPAPPPEEAAKNEAPPPATPADPPAPEAAAAPAATPAATSPAPEPLGDTSPWAFAAIAAACIGGVGAILWRARSRRT